MTGHLAIIDQIEGNPGAHNKNWIDVLRLGFLPLACRSKAGVP
jgi:hypothetical protein